MSEKVTPPVMGRPPFKPSIEQRQTVEEMKYFGESENCIARAIGIDDDTLRKHFADELADGHAARRKEVIGLLFKSARDGNVSAARRLEEIGRIAGALDGFGDQPEEKAPRALKLGKKEVARQEAMAAGTSSEWGDDLKPPTDLLPN